MDEDVKYYNLFLSGDKQALGEVVKLYNDKLILFVNNYVKDLSVAEDIVADSFVEILIRKTKFKENAKFKTWLFRIARNNAIDYLRKNSKNKNNNLCNGVSSDDNIELELIRKEQYENLYLTMQTLKSEYKEVLYLEYFEEMSYSEIAKVMRKSEKQIKNLVYRAKKSLKEKLYKEDFFYEKL